MALAGEICRVGVRHMSLNYPDTIRITVVAEITFFYALFIQMFKNKKLSVSAYVWQQTPGTCHLGDARYGISFSGPRSLIWEDFLWFLMHCKFSPNGNYCGLWREMQILTEMPPFSITIGSRIMWSFYNNHNCYSLPSFSRCQVLFRHSVCFKSFNFYVISLR